MSFPARVFRVLVASPSDVIDEREIVAKTIQEWNDLNSGERQLVLLPLRWETHSAPEYGRRPQEVINRQIVDQCDFLIGIFWTKIGSPTGGADSGTLEEIERVANAGKPVMLYFSRLKQDPDLIELDQLKKLREFKKKTFPRALVEHYSSLIELRDKIAKQIEIQIRSLLAEQSEEQGGESAIGPVTDISLNFADPETGAKIGSSLELKTALIKITEDIPDYTPKYTEHKEAIPIIGATLSTANRDFFRDAAKYVIFRSYFRPLRFWMKNIGSVGARDLYIDMSLSAKPYSIKIAPIHSLPDLPSKTNPTWATLTTSTTSVTSFVYPAAWSYLSRAHQEEEDTPQESDGMWRTFLELKALQPQREIAPPRTILIGADEDCKVIVDVKIYADTLSIPIHHILEIDMKVEPISYGSKQLIQLLEANEADKLCE